MLGELGRRSDVHRKAARHQIGYCSQRALVGHMAQIEFCEATELNPREMDGPARPRRAEDRLVWVRLEPGNKLGQRADGQFPADNDCLVELEDLGDRSQVDQGIVAEVRINMRMDREQAVWGKKQSCSVRSRVLD